MSPTRWGRPQVIAMGWEQWGIRIFRNWVYTGSGTSACLFFPWDGGPDERSGQVVVCFSETGLPNKSLARGGQCVSLVETALVWVCENNDWPNHKPRTLSPEDLAHLAQPTVFPALWSMGKTSLPWPKPSWWRWTGPGKARGLHLSSARRYAPVLTHCICGRRPVPRDPR
jgi:hypothetical protein